VPQTENEMLRLSALGGKSANRLGLLKKHIGKGFGLACRR